MTNLTNLNKTIILVGDEIEFDPFLSIIKHIVPDATVIPFTTAEETNALIASTDGLKVVTGIESDDDRCAIPKATVIHCWGHELGHELTWLPGDYQALDSRMMVDEVVIAALTGEHLKSNVMVYEEDMNWDAEYYDEDSEEETPVSAPVNVEQEPEFDDFAGESDNDYTEKETGTDDENEDAGDDDFIPVVIVTGGAGDFVYGAPYNDITTSDRHD